MMMVRFAWELANIAIWARCVVGRNIMQRSYRRTYRSPRVMPLYHRCIYISSPTAGCCYTSLQPKFKTRHSYDTAAILKFEVNSNFITPNARWVSGPLETIDDIAGKRVARTLTRADDNVGELLKPR
ncbi:uncharacterized protein EDB93DRAFT_854374 [Suillus bovinus]|uniref:uncharacterized protein n=1 Tax=Suillus bovinus TaxID=48563 RepID=UPI001B85F1FA|nr:uncharacterized protein EDB93DRAFT_854374 [Suillus bovinus]KAG2133785.1 hypothetical protein EDB93DRAFT_854374 [Suillus bovinus]